MGFETIYAGETDRQHGIYAVKRPNIPAPVERMGTPVELPGRDHVFSQRTGVYDDMPIPVEYNYLSKRPEDWAKQFREAVLWLRKKGVLQFSDDLSVFYKVDRVEIGEDERTVKRLGRFAATFICLPGWYFTEGAKFIAMASGKIVNYYSTAKPVYELTGTGTCEISVNGSTMEAKVDGKLYIDTDLESAYKSSEDRQNTAVKGYYEDLVLVSGVNTITVSDGFGLRVRPNWRVL